MKTKDLKKLIKYWPDEGEVHIEGCELEKEDIWCIATDPEWRETNLVKLEDLERTRRLLHMLLDSPTEDDDVKNKVKNEIKRMNIEIDELRKSISEK